MPGFGDSRWGPGALLIKLRSQKLQLQEQRLQLVKEHRHYKTGTFTRGFPGGSEVKAPACNAGDLGWEDSLEKEMATHSSILAWRIP